MNQKLDYGFESEGKRVSKTMNFFISFKETMFFLNSVMSTFYIFWLNDIRIWMLIRDYCSPICLTDIHKGCVDVIGLKGGALQFHPRQIKGQHIVPSVEG